MKDYVDMPDAEVLRETPKALLFDFGHRELWIPKSVLKLVPCPPFHDTYFVRKWWVTRKRLWAIIDAKVGPCC